MDANEVLATGGASGLTGLILFVLYKIITGKWKIKSACCGKVISVETNIDTPKEIIIENPMPK
jgi:hypothetical protein